MVDVVKSEAEMLAVAVEVSLVSVSEVVDWAYKVIGAQARPHWSVCELATASAWEAPDVASALRSVPGVADEAWVGHALVVRLARCLANDHSRADRVAESLAWLARSDRLRDSEVVSLADWAWDALVLADEGLTVETRDQVIEAMLATLNEAAARRTLEE